MGARDVAGAAPGSRVADGPLESFGAARRARLTASGLQREGVRMTLVRDTAGGLLPRRDRVDLVAVGADRIAANGDVASRIGSS